MINISISPYISFRKSSYLPQKACLLFLIFTPISCSSATPYYTFDNKGCHRSSNFLTTKVFTVYLDKNTIYSVVNPERKEVEVVFQSGNVPLL